MFSIYLPSCGAWNLYHFLIYIFSTLINVDIEPENIYIDMSNIYFETNHNFIIELLNIKYPKARIINCSKCPADTLLLNELSYMIDLHNNNNIKQRFCVYNFVYNSFIDNVKEMCDFVKNKYSKKIYISRKDSINRNIINEIEVMEYLKPIGFQLIVLSNMSLIEQFAIFYNSEVIIGVCGAALTNIIFAKPNTQIIEISSSYLSSSIHFEDISNCFKLNHSRYLNTTIIKNHDDMANHLFINDIQSIYN